MIRIVGLCSQLLLILPISSSVPSQHPQGGFPQVTSAEVQNDGISHGRDEAQAEDTDPHHHSRRKVAPSVKVIPCEAQPEDEEAGDVAGHGRSPECTGEQEDHAQRL